MTRGTGYLITDSYWYSHDEFNGNMYPEGWGRDFLILLHSTTPASYPHLIAEWNKTHHNYNDLESYKTLQIEIPWITKKENKLTIDFTKWDEWMSDWIFIKNATLNPIEIITRTDIDKIAGETIILKEGETRAFWYGTMEKSYSYEDIVK